jgi:hypothetical protein
MKARRGLARARQSDGLATFSSQFLLGYNNKIFRVLRTIYLLQLAGEWRTYLSPPEKMALKFFKESCMMRHKLQVKFWGISINAEGIVAIAASLLIVFAILAVCRF